jgi:hypothetical protein
MVCQLAIGIAMIGITALASSSGAFAQTNPCAAKNPCASKAAAPGAATNPCAAKNPCVAKQPAASPSQKPSQKNWAPTQARDRLNEVQAR